MKYLFVFLLLGAVFASCNPKKKYAEEIQEIESYEKALDSLTNVYSTIKFDSLIYIQKKASQSEKLIKRYYTADTISIGLAERLRFIKSVRKSLSNIQVKKKTLAREISTLKEQFSTLEIDVRSGVYSRDQIAQYLAEEKKAYNNLTENLGAVLDNQKKQLHDFYYAYPMVDNYIELIKPTEDQN